MEEEGVLDKSTETMAVMGEEERENLMKLCEASMPEEFGRWVLRSERRASRGWVDRGVLNFGKYEKWRFWWR